MINMIAIVIRDKVPNMYVMVRIARTESKSCAIMDIKPIIPMIVPRMYITIHRDASS
jgi:hypothetical protein